MVEEECETKVANLLASISNLPSSDFDAKIGVLLEIIELQQKQIQDLEQAFYELVDGERRLRLAKELGYKSVPVTVIDVDDETARRMVWKINTLRQDYTPKEKAFHFRSLQKDYGLSLRGIARECDYDEKTVTAYLNIFRLPDKYQESVWDGQIPIRAIIELGVLFNGGAERSAEIIGWLDQVMERKGFGAEQLREALRPRLAELRQKLKVCFTQVGTGREAEGQRCDCAGTACP